MLELSFAALLVAVVLMGRDLRHDFAPVYAGFPDGGPPDRERPAWADLLMFKGGGSAPKPDKNIGKAALMQAETGQQWLDFAKEQFAIGNERQDEIDALTNQVTEAQIASMNDANARATEQWDRYKSVFQPIEDEYIKEATTWGSEERQAKMAAEAKADVLSNAAAAKQQNQRNMASMGIDPTSGRYAGVDRANDLNTALAAAGAQNQARDQVRGQALALKEGVANMGRGATSTSAQQVGLGLNAGNSAVGNTATGQQLWQSNANIMSQGYGGAMQGYAGMASTLNQQYSNQLAGWQANQQSAAGFMGGIGNLAGTAAGLYAASSKEFKEDKEPMEGGDALSMLEQMPVEHWKYKEGIADEGEHIGPYAEDFQAATGKGDGKTINLMDAIGVTMRAVQELNEKVESLGGGGIDALAAGAAPAKRATAKKEVA